MSRLVRVLVLGALLFAVGTAVAWGSFTATKVTPQTITAGSWGSSDLVVQAKTLQPNSSTQQIHPVLELVNRGTTSVDLSRTVIRYWFTDDPLNGSPVFYCFYAVINCANITGALSYLDPVRQGADYYLTIGFTSGAGMLQPGKGTGPLDFGIQNSMGQFFDQSDDWSFAGLTGTMSDAAHITASVSNFLVWGQEPEVSKASLSAYVLYMNNATSTNGDAAAQFGLNIVNESTSALDQDGITVRYWFTSDGPPATFDSSCYSPPLCPTASFQPVTPPRTKADMYMQLRLPAGTVRSGDGTGYIHVAFNRTGYYPNIDETNDWSWAPVAPSLAHNPNITVYYRGVLIGGTEPPG